MRTERFVGYAAIVWDEPIEGVKSHRLYGLFLNSDAAWEALKELKPSLGRGVLPIRARDELLEENRYAMDAPAGEGEGAD